MREHLIAAHKIRCEKIMEVDCPLSPKLASAEACANDVAAGLSGGDSGLNRPIPDAASETCLGALRQVAASDCKSVQKRMSQPPCDMRTLLGLPAPSAPPLP